MGLTKECAKVSKDPESLFSRADKVFQHQLWENWLLDETPRCLDKSTLESFPLRMSHPAAQPEFLWILSSLSQKFENWRDTRQGCRMISLRAAASHPDFSLSNIREENISRASILYSTKRGTTRLTLFYCWWCSTCNTENLCKIFNEISST